MWAATWACSFRCFCSGCLCPPGGVSALYFLRNYGLLLAVGIVCASPITLKVDKVLRRHKLLQGIFLAVLLVITIAYMVDATNSPFLYFRF